MVRVRANDIRHDRNQGGSATHHVGAVQSAGHSTAILRSRKCPPERAGPARSEEHTSELQSRPHLVCRLLLEKKKKEICAILTRRECSASDTHNTRYETRRAR